MKNEHNFRSDLLICASVMIAFTLSGCGSLMGHQPLSEVAGTIKPSNVVVKRPPAIEEAKNYAAQFAPMAFFSQMAYRKDIADNKERQGHGCDYFNKGKDYEKVVKLDVLTNETGHWERSLDPGSCVEDGGLFFETYVHKNKSEKIDQAVIAFRGTENTTIYEELRD
jgi:hypothetical protein